MRKCAQIYICSFTSHRWNFWFGTESKKIECIMFHMKKFEILICSLRQWCVRFCGSSFDLCVATAYQYTLQSQLSHVNAKSPFTWWISLIQIPIAFSLCWAIVMQQHVPVWHISYIWLICLPRLSAFLTKDVHYGIVTMLTDVQIGIPQNFVKIHFVTEADSLKLNELRFCSHQ